MAAMMAANWVDETVAQRDATLAFLMVALMDEKLEPDLAALMAENWAELLAGKQAGELELVSGELLVALMVGWTEGEVVV